MVLVDGAITRAITILEADTDPIARARLAERLSDRMRLGAEQFAEIRSAAFVELRDNGWSLADMKAEFGIARARLSQLINRDDYRAARRTRGRT